MNGQVEILPGKSRELFIASRFRVLWLFLLPPFGQRQQQARAVYSGANVSRTACKYQARAMHASVPPVRPRRQASQNARRLNVCRPATTPANACHRSTDLPTIHALERTTCTHPPDRELKISFEGRDPSALRHAYHEHEARGETKTCSDNRNIQDVDNRNIQDVRHKRCCLVV